MNQESDSPGIPELHESIAAHYDGPTRGDSEAHGRR
jgi:hypothetical protein